MAMNVIRTRNISWQLLALGLGFAAVSTTGCQVDVGGQTLPSAYWQTDDVQYFPPGPEFKLSREAAELRAQRLSQGLPRVPAPPAPVAPAPEGVAPAPAPGAPPPLAAPPAAAPPVAAPPGAGEMPPPDMQ
jgi:hypothetical protein